MSSLRQPGTMSDHPDAYWRGMRFFTLYRLLLAGVLLGHYFLLREQELLPSFKSPLYLQLLLGYLVFGVGSAVAAVMRLERFNRLLTLQAVGDIGFIILLIYAAGGLKSGLGLLLVIAVAAASLISQGRLALFYAALACIALLLQQSWQIFSGDEHYENYTHAIMLGMSCFATAWLAHSLAGRTRQSEELASQRGVDLENLGQVNEIILRDMLDGVMVVDHDLYLRHHNAQAGVLLGVPLAGGEKLSLSEFAPETAGLLRRWMQDAREARTDTVKTIVAGKEVRLRFLPVGNTPSRGAVIFIEDWERVQARARQLKLVALGRLTANLAHEIRNPLSSISHASQLLQEEPNINATTQRLLQIILDNSSRLDHMVSDLMQISRRDRSQQENIVLADFLREFRDQFCQAETLSPECLRLEISHQQTTVLFDRDHLHQVLWNLCRNGWQHGKKQPGSLTLRLAQSRRKNELVLSVADDGAGVGTEARKHLFEPFFTTEPGGTGLGLYLARELCEANDASLDCPESATGGLFNVYLKKT